jgi:hypothetical protein
MTREPSPSIGLVVEAFTLMNVTASGFGTVFGFGFQSSSGAIEQFERLFLVVVDMVTAKPYSFVE